MTHPSRRAATAGPAPARIPADVELPDKVLGPLTARQLAVLAATAAGLYLLWQAAREVVPLTVFLAAAGLVLAVATAVVTVCRDGLTLDRLALAAIHHHRTGTQLLTAPARVELPPAWLAATAVTDPDSGPPPRPRAWEPPARGVAASGTSGGMEIGVVDLAERGLAVIAAASTVNFALRTPGEQEALVGGFGRYLHSLTAPVQVLIRAERIDLSDRIDDLRARAGGLPDRGLTELARDHAGFLADLAVQTELLHRQVLLVWREPGPGPSRRRGLGASARRTATDRLARRVGEATELLAPVGITVTPLDAAAAGAVLAATTNPALPVPPSPDAAAPDEVITARPSTMPSTGEDSVEMRRWMGPDGIEHDVLDRDDRGEADDGRAAARSRRWSR